jgi:hypothetical protein
MEKAGNDGTTSFAVTFKAVAAAVKHRRKTKTGNMADLCVLIGGLYTTWTFFSFCIRFRKIHSPKYHEARVHMRHFHDKLYFMSISGF